MGEGGGDELGGVVDFLGGDGDGWGEGDDIAEGAIGEEDEAFFEELGDEGDDDVSGGLAVWVAEFDAFHEAGAADFVDEGEAVEG